jgi:hypothetical protein
MEWHEPLGRRRRRIRGTPELTHLRAASSPRRAPVVTASQRERPNSGSSAHALLISSATRSGSGGFGRRRASFGGWAYCAGLRSTHPQEIA